MRDGPKRKHEFRPHHTATLQRPLLQTFMYDIRSFGWGVRVWRRGAQPDLDGRPACFVPRSFLPARDLCIVGKAMYFLEYFMQNNEKVRQKFEM